MTAPNTPTGGKVLRGAIAVLAVVFVALSVSASPRAAKRAVEQAAHKIRIQLTCRYC